MSELAKLLGDDQDNVELLRARLDSLILENGQLQEQNEKLQEKFLDVEEENYQLKEEKEKLETQLKNIELVRSQLKKFKKMDRHIVDLQRKIKFLKIKSQSDEESIQKCHQEIVKQMQKNEDLESSHSTALSSVKTDNINHKATIASLKMDMEKIKEKYARSQNKENGMLKKNISGKANKRKHKFFEGFEKSSGRYIKKRKEVLSPLNLRINQPM